MDEEIIKQIIDELFTSLEPLEANSAAVIQFLKAKGLATDEELAPFLEQAGNAASVRWRAARVRTAALIANALKSAAPPKETTVQPDAPSSRAQREKNARGQPKDGADKAKEKSSKEEAQSVPEGAQNPTDKSSTHNDSSNLENQQASDKKESPAANAPGTSKQERKDPAA